MLNETQLNLAVAPARERGLKWFFACGEYGDNTVAPARERGLKFANACVVPKFPLVAPARERGLKCIEDSEGAEQDVWSLPRGSVD